MTLIRLLLIALISMMVGGPRNTPLTPIYREYITIRSVPVTIEPANPARTRVGALNLVGGWRLSSLSAQFGGWSAVHIEGDRVTMLGDAGALLQFRLAKFGRAVDAQISPLPPGCARTKSKRDRDSESLARGPDGWWIGYESRARICRVSPDWAQVAAVETPADMAAWPIAGGPEAMVRLSDGRFLVFAEDARDGGALRPLLLFEGDPTNFATRVTRLRYRPPVGYSPTDAAQLPDGRLLVLNRRFSATQLFTAVLVVIDPATLTVRRPVTGKPIARFAPPLLSDNYEGLAVTVERGQPVVWITSDDNFMGWEATYLLKFALDRKF